jgi:hypothetical protein
MMMVQLADTNACSQNAALYLMYCVCNTTCMQKYGMTNLSTHQNAQAVLKQQQQQQLLATNLSCNCIINVHPAKWLPAYMYCRLAD